MSSLMAVVVFVLLGQLTSSWAIEFDIWSTGISRQEMTNLAKEHNIPLVKDGYYLIKKTFDPALLAGEGNSFHYNTQLLEHPARVNLLLSPRKGEYGQFLYEIDVMFTDVRKNKDLKPYLAELLDEKYGRGRPGTNLIQTFRVWSPEKGAEVRLISGPGSLQLKYTDLKIKAIAEKMFKSTFDLPAPQKHGDTGKF
jgi:hypothetical protein